MSSGGNGGRPPAPPMTFLGLFNPFGVGRRVFKPSRPDRVQDPVVSRIQIIRTVVGLAVVAWILLSYDVVADADGVIDDRMSQAGTTFILLMVTFPLVVVGFVAAARPPNRGMLLRRVGRPAAALAVLVASVTVPRLLTYSGYDPRDHVRPDPTGILTVLGGFWFLYWFCPFVLYGIVQSLVHVFRTADIHETVPPVLTILLVWELALVDAARGAYDSAPFGARTALTLGPPLAVTVVAMWELRRLRTRHGVTLRAALRR
ncbi:hypothetical protein [Streptomyces sp. NPDC058653]|uniref:hypothetical protein n=1 Tax=Streptomyces sp. NPDC058653 TaxID=3346576 RepID=UPI00364DD51B